MAKDKTPKVVDQEESMDVDGHDKPVEQVATQTVDLPRDVVIVDSILREMGAREYDPKVVAQLLEFTHRMYLPNST